jgi:hypothetical protein
MVRWQVKSKPGEAAFIYEKPAIFGDTDKNSYLLMAEKSDMFKQEITKNGQ